MMRLDTCPSDIRKSAIESSSRVRWNWDDQRPYKISDIDMYDSRFEHFRQFRTDFYADVNPTPLSCDNDNLFFSYPLLDIAVVGFSSWYENDCYCQVGDIDPTSINSSRAMLNKSSVSVAIAVWHHNIVGGPRAQDYMDQRVIHRLIDFGFNIGLHGHQHYPGAAPFELNLPSLTSSMVVVGAGSLAVGDHALPPGEPRQFNIVEIDHDSRSVTVHVRAMLGSGIFVGHNRSDFGGHTYIKLSFRSDYVRSHSTSTKLLDTAMTAVSRGEFDNALKFTADIDDPRHSFTLRQIKIKALSGLGRSDDLLDVLDPPQNADELTMAVRLLLDDRRFDDASRRLEMNHELLDQETLDMLRNNIEVRRIV